MSRVLVLVALVLAAVLAVLILSGSGTVGVLYALGFLFVVVAVYLGSLLVP